MRITLDVALLSATVFRRAATLSLVVTSVTISTRAAAAPAQIEVRGAASLEARARVDADATAVILAGTLGDEAAAPIPAALVTMELVAPQPGPPGGELPPPEACVPARGAAPRWAEGAGARGGAYELVTDASGAFCVRMTGAPGRAVVRLRYEGSSLYDATTIEVPLDPTSRRVTLQLLPDVVVTPVDRGLVRWTAVARVLGAAGATGESPGASLALTLGDERGGTLGAATTDASGEARFEVPSGELGPPGPGELRLDFAGGDALSAAHLVRRIERRATARLHPAVEAVEAAQAGESVSIDVDVVWTGGKVPSGAVEGTRGGRSVGAAAVRDGRATVVVTLTSEQMRQEGDGGALELRYVPDAPYWEPGGTATVRVVPPAPSAWRRAPLLLVAAAVAWWVLRGWRRRPEPKRRIPRVSGRARVSSVALVRADPAGGGWTGRVVDAHDGAPVALAVVTLVAPAFGGESIAATTRTASDGAFALGAFRAERGVRLRVEAPLHATLEQALPPPGELVVALASRRRRLLDRLVEWSRSAGGAWQPSPEPTPGQIARIAARMRGSDETVGSGPPPERVEVWAHALEDAAYGTSPVDETVERDIAALEPRGR